MAVTSSGRAKVTNLVQPDHATAFPSGRENPVQAHCQRGAETSGYREAILTCPDLQARVLSEKSSGSIRKLRRIQRRSTLSFRDDGRSGMPDMDPLPKKRDPDNDRTKTHRWVATPRGFLWRFTLHAESILDPCRLP
jgi:hypothetical protein